MKFISLASFGSYLASCPEVDVDSMEMNSYHKALLNYSFLKTTESMFSEYFCGEAWEEITPDWDAHDDVITSIQYSTITNW